MNFEEFVQYARNAKRLNPDIMNSIWDVVSYTYDKISDDGVPAHIQIPIGIESINDLIKDLKYKRKKEN